MLTKEIIKQTLQAHDADLKAMGVRSLSLFGSYARGEQKKRSDIDFVVEYKTMPSLFDLAGTQYELKKIFRRNIDIMTVGSIHPALKHNIIAEMEKIYEAET